MKIIYILLISIPGVLSNSGFSRQRLETGDLIFQESCQGEVGNAIKGVTNSMEGYNFTHVGIVYTNGKDTLVIEATPPEVKITPIEEYLKPVKEDCAPKSVAARLKPQYRHLISKAIEEALYLIGKKYDYTFTLNDDTYYCSELIYEIFLKANNDWPLFELNVMTFKDKETGDFLEEWVNYYQKLNKEIPEGEMGINPGAISKSGILEIIGKLQ